MLKPTDLVRTGDPLIGRKDESMDQVSADRNGFGGVWRDITRRYFLQSGSAFGIMLGVFPQSLLAEKNFSEKNMLKSINPLLTGDLLAILSDMGHGDEIVLADANFPAASIARRLVRLPGLTATDVLTAVLSVLPLDDFVDRPAAAMDAPGEHPAIYPEYEAILKKAAGRPIVLEPVERFAFYDRAKAAYAVVATGELRLYANIILKKGVLRP